MQHAFFKAFASHARSSCVLPTQLRAPAIVELALTRAPEQRTRASEHPKLLEAPPPSEHAKIDAFLRPQTRRRGV